MENDKPGFVAKTIKLSDESKNNNFIAKSARKDIFDSTSAQKDNLPTKPIVNLDDLHYSILQMYRDVKANISGGNAIIFKGWHNKRLELDLKRQRLLIEQIDNLGIAAETLANTEAKLFMSVEMRESLIAGMENGIQVAAKLAIAKLGQAETAIKKAEDEKQAIDDGAEARKLALDSSKMQMQMFELKTRAEVNLMEARTQEAKAKARLIEEVVNNLNFENLPPTLQTYIISSVFNPMGNQFQDFEMQEQLKQYVKRSVEADTEIKESQRDIAKAKSGATVAEIHQVRNTIKE